jgi:hypothetical protein
MAHWGRDLAIASAALTVGYLVFSPSKHTQVAASANQMKAAPTVDQLQLASQNKQARAAVPTQIAPLDPQSPKSSVAPNRDFERSNETIKAAAAIAAMLVQESRNAYYASGRPCA